MGSGGFATGVYEWLIVFRILVSIVPRPLALSRRGRDERRWYVRLLARLSNDRISEGSGEPRLC